MTNPAVSPARALLWAARGPCRASSVSKNSETVIPTTWLGPSPISARPRPRSDVNRSSESVVQNAPGNWSTSAPDGIPGPGHDPGGDLLLSNIHGDSAELPLLHTGTSSRATPLHDRPGNSFAQSAMRVSAARGRQVTPTGAIASRA